MFEATEGKILINNFDIKKNTKEIYKCIGICPQFDVLWDNLTPLEHLLFFSRLRGIPPSLELFHSVFFLLLLLLFYFLFIIIFIFIYFIFIYFILIFI